MGLGVKSCESEEVRQSQFLTIHDNGKFKNEVTKQRASVEKGSSREHLTKCMN